ncbi:glycoside hydrolase family 16 protein [Catellatospora vulcania]|uniref:glycoside hydrolase family 16 protein n=1 Tax=Catellatospora vulcania TaxID=1460450 RepID=UPI0018AFBC21|nr:glycoside hydrolase family 16 protein [Catellatospora vulcania]
MQSDEFNGTALDTGKWGVYHDPYGNHPRVREAVAVRDGELRITGAIRDGRDVSGGIASRVNQLYGRWEVRLRVDRGAGYNGVALLWPKSEQWPEDGEINMIEVNKGERATGLNYLHNKTKTNKQDQLVRADFTSWHTVAVDWLPGRVIFYLDGRQTWSVPNATASASLVPSTSPMHLALQLDKGCDSFTPCRDGGTPAEVTLHVDWIKIYARA